MFFISDSFIVTRESDDVSYDYFEKKDGWSSMKNQDPDADTDERRKSRRARDASYIIKLCSDRIDKIDCFEEKLELLIFWANLSKIRFSS